MSSATLDSPDVQPTAGQLRRPKENKGEAKEPAPRDREIFHDHVVRGISQQQIAEAYGLTQSRVSAICQNVDRYYQRTLASTRAEVKVRVQLRYDYLYAETIEAWERSKAGSKVRRRKNSAKNGQETTQEHSSSSGDPRHLANARAILSDMRALWGLDEPETDDSDEEIQAQLERLTAADLAKLAAADEVRQRALGPIETTATRTRAK